MALDAYSPCPCGSGKKFKWCCQPIHVELDRAFQQESEGQHDMALRIMDEVIAAHPTNPEPLGRKAQLLYQHQQTDEAEATLDKALALNANYPFGHLLRGLIRQEEGEVPGALLLFRRAADLYDPEATDFLGQIYALITDCEMQLRRPVAAHAALKIAVRCQPGNEDLRRLLDEHFGAQSQLPRAARADYIFQSPPAAASGARRQAWDKALGSAGRLSEAAKAFEQLTREDDTDAPAWFDLALVRAWLGDNRAALEAMDRYVALEADEARAATGWALGEVLRCGHGMEGQSDYVEHFALFQIRDPQRFFTFLGEYQQERRFVPVQVNQEQGLVTGLVLEKKPALTPELAATQVAGLGAYILILGGHVRVWHVDPAALAQVRDELAQRAGPALALAREGQGVASFNDLLAEAMAFPLSAASEEEAKKRINDHVARFFEERWIHRPLKTLNQVPPVDAVGHPVLKKKLLGVIEFLRDCAAISQAQGYDFDRLRQKLGLQAGKPAPAAQGPDVGVMSAAELSALSAEQLADEQLEHAYQAALKLDARDLAGRFARTLVARPVQAGSSQDRYPWYSHLVQLAANEGDLDSALNFVNEGEKADCEHNEGRRRNDYELRRGQLHARRGEADQAQDVFDRLIQRVPAELRFRSSAAEAMLSAKQPQKARQFAEQGLAKAREQNDRDSENHFLELVDAAKKRGG